MSALTQQAREISSTSGERALRYSICTLVTNPEEYASFKESFEAGGFTSDTCEYLYLDNSQGNRFEAFGGYNLFLQEAQGTYIILCHQDVELLVDGRARLDAVLAELTAKDAQWGLCGNAGAKTDGSLALRITDPNTGPISQGGPFPVRVISLDENFIVVRREANLALSHDLSGFHLYGTDLCLNADSLGLHAYVIDFHLLHKSGGNPDESFERLRLRMRDKYRRVLRPRWQHMTTYRSFYLSPSPIGAFLARGQRAITRRLIRR